MSTWPGSAVMLLHEPLDFTCRDKQFIEYAQQKRIVATNWLFRDYANFHKHADTLRAYFEPETGVRKKVETYLSTLRASRSILVGVHIRRGDYRQWQNGKYCYPDAVYAQLMQSIVDLYGHDRVGFVLCSNEPINEENFRQFNVAIPRNTFIEELTLLSGCDQIIGPPSSFSGWASFVGNTPLYHIIDYTKPLSATSFEVTMG
ncbi:hypothetical protein HNV11_00730 [Spirosoma taeanense]|uniref:Glycosyl transferase family 11 n=1 Tax=Spirosoma taeanense TaxID=2735870 RepID=A0A6M5Y2I5_9BACT|nr:alpha-1,2-fucosyltransferase [Spirosoma taeanense]QJW87999.1 hypothetical protein HNV11_00730 [Spirosoma taeanense]